MFIVKLVKRSFIIVKFEAKTGFWPAAFFGGACLKGLAKAWGR